MAMAEARASGTQPSAPEHAREARSPRGRSRAGKDRDLSDGILTPVIQEERENDRGGEGLDLSERAILFCEVTLFSFFFRKRSPRTERHEPDRFHPPGCERVAGPPVEEIDPAGPRSQWATGSVASDTCTP